MIRPENRPPRWVVMSASIVVLLAVAFVVLHLTGNGMAGVH
jgi:hypothetical protein